MLIETRVHIYAYSHICTIIFMHFSTRSVFLFNPTINFCNCDRENFELVLIEIDKLFTTLSLSRSTKSRLLVL